MTPKRLTKTLVEFGLTEAQAAVYLAMLSLGRTTVLKIARATNLKRTSLYSTIDALKENGLITTEVRGFKKYFVPENPERLQKTLERRRAILNTALPELSSLFHLQGDAGDIRYYEGLTAIKGVYEDLLKTIKHNDDYLIISDVAHWLTLDREYFLDFSMRRAKLPIKIRMLLQPSAEANELKQRGPAMRAAIKFLPASIATISNLIVTPQRVVIHQLVPPIRAVVIENKSVIQLHRELFEIIWKSLP